MFFIYKNICVLLSCCQSCQSVDLEWYKFGISILKHVSRTSRFVMMLMFLSTADKTLLKTTVDLLEVRVKQNGEKTLQNDISNIRAAYKCS